MRDSLAANVSGDGRISSFFSLFFESEMRTQAQASKITACQRQISLITYPGTARFHRKRRPVIVVFQTVVTFGLARTLKPTSLAKRFNRQAPAIDNPDLNDLDILHVTPRMQKRNDIIQKDNICRCFSILIRDCGEHHPPPPSTKE